MIRKLLTVAALSLVSLPATPALATIATWTLHGVKFDDGGTATGTFSYDMTTDTLSAFNIKTSGGTLGMSTSNMSAFPDMSSDLTQFYIYDNNYQNMTGYDIEMQFASPLVSGQPAQISSGQEDYVYYDPQNYQKSYQVTRHVISGDLTSGVPETSTWAMMLTGFGVVGWSMRRRKVRASYG